MDVEIAKTADMGDISCAIGTILETTGVSSLEVFVVQIVVVGEEE